MTYKYKILLGVSPVVFALDQLTKFLVAKHLSLGMQISVLPGFFDLVYIRNTGAAFGMFATLVESVRIPFFYGISAFAVLILIYAFKSLDARDRFYPWPLSLVSGGVLGNLIDRLRFGNVIDFLSIHVQDKVLWGIKLDWPAFNIADSAITISMVLLAAHILKSK